MSFWVVYNSSHIYIDICVCVYISIYRLISLGTNNFQYTDYVIPLFSIEIIQNFLPLKLLSMNLTLFFYC